MTRDEFCDTVWDAMVRRYQRPGLADICLAMQDEHDVDIVFALLLSLADRAGLTPEPAQADALEASVEEWRRQVVLPLRRVRRWQKAQSADAAELAHRAAIKRLELEAEKLELARLTAAFRKLGDMPDRSDSARRYLLRQGVRADLVDRFLAV